MPFQVVVAHEAGDEELHGEDIPTLEEAVKLLQMLERRYKHLRKPPMLIIEEILK